MKNVVSLIVLISSIFALTSCCSVPPKESNDINQEYDFF